MVKRRAGARSRSIGGVARTGKSSNIRVLVCSAGSSVVVVVLAAGYVFSWLAGVPEFSGCFSPVWVWGGWFCLLSLLGSFSLGWLTLSDFWCWV